MTARNTHMTGMKEFTGLVLGVVREFPPWDMFRKTSTITRV